MLTETPTASHHPFIGLMQPARGVLRSVATLWRLYRNRQAIKQLLARSDIELSDIGVQRSDVLAALDGPKFEDASQRLSDRRAASRRARQHTK